VGYCLILFMSNLTNLDVVVHRFAVEAAAQKLQSLSVRNVIAALQRGVEHDMSGHGQTRTRIQAFIEMLEL
jgi:benzoyl-CoA reductase/2-hydroxyglutaryl-CoA dehydratase subunit BcrC/BadD/HgdB